MHPDDFGFLSAGKAQSRARTYLGTDVFCRSVKYISFRTYANGRLLGTFLTFLGKGVSQFFKFRKDRSQNIHPGPTATLINAQSSAHEGLHTKRALTQPPRQGTVDRHGEVRRAMCPGGRVVG